MSGWITEIVLIEKVEHHPNADALDLVTVLGDYPVITKRDEYKVGDLAAYIGIDTVVPDTEFWHFLCPKAYEKYEEDGEIKQRQIGSKYPVGIVPEKHRILKAMAEIKSKLGNHICEGWVLNLGKERFEPRLNSRLKLKYISEQYNLQK